MSDTKDNAILSHIKTYVDIATDDDDSYDDRIIQDIEIVLAELHLLTNVKRFVVDNTTTFSDVVEDTSEENLALVKRFISVSVRILFDPPTGSVLASLEKVKDNTASMITVIRSFKQENE